MQFEIQIKQCNSKQAIQLLNNLGFSFMAGSSEHNNETVLHIHGTIGCLDSAEKALQAADLF